MYIAFTEAFHLHYSDPQLILLSKYASFVVNYICWIHTLCEQNGEILDVQSGYTGLSKKMDGIWNRYNLKSTGRIYTFGILKCSEKFKVLDLA